MADPIRWTYAFVDRPMKDFGRACGFWTAGHGDEAVRTAR